MFKAFLFDLDGTVYRGSEAVPGAAEFITQLQLNQTPYRFVTNRSNRPPSVIVNHLQGLGVPCSEEHVMTSARATAKFLGSGSAFVIGEIGLKQELISQGVKLEDQHVDYVVVGFDGEFNYRQLEHACLLIRQGAKLIATNPDAYYHTDLGLSPETGSLVAAIECGSGAKAHYVGKPQALIVEMCLAEMGVAANNALLIGDNLDTDIPAGYNANVRTALILSGVSQRGDLQNSNIQPTWVIEDYSGLENLLLSL